MLHIDLNLMLKGPVIELVAKKDSHCRTTQTCGGYLAFQSEGRFSAPYFTVITLLCYVIMSYVIGDFKDAKHPCIRTEKAIVTDQSASDLAEPCKTLVLCSITV